VVERVAKTIHDAMVYAVCEFKGEPRAWQNGNSTAESYARREARDIIAALQSRVLPQAGMREALEDLQQAEAEYRLMHDRHGDGSQAAGRAWDLMRRAGDKARALLDAALATAPIPMSENHLAQRQQDEYFCARCKKRWPIEEEAPSCQG
jgi:hypothetical protein